MAAVHRIEVRTKDGMPDARGEALLRRAAAESGLAQPSAVRSAQVYLIEGSLTGRDLQGIADRLLADPVTQVATIGSHAAQGFVVEVLPLPGVADPAAESVELAIARLVSGRVRVLTGDRWDMAGVNRAEADEIGRRLLANPVVQSMRSEPWMPERFPEARAHAAQARDVPILDLSDAQLERLSREAHLFLSLEEMRAIQSEWRRLVR
jgi:phosphoribosylformylglycinamidine synthase